MLGLLEQEPKGKRSSSLSSSALSLNSLSLNLSATDVPNEVAKQDLPRENASAEALLSVDVSRAEASAEAAPVTSAPEAATAPLSAPPSSMSSALSAALETPSSAASKIEPLDTDSWIASALEKEKTEEANGEFEVVMGRRQIATWMFLGLIVIGVVGMFSYLAGKSAAPKSVVSQAKEQTATQAVVPTAANSATANAQTPANSNPVAATPLPQAGITRLPSFGAPVNSGKPIFGEPEIGKIYLQIGAVSKGMAVILTEGLRSHGFESFVAPGPSASVFRVLIGPLKDPDAFTRAKNEIDSIDLGSFVRRYEKGKDDAKPVATAMPSSPAN